MTSLNNILKPGEEVLLRYPAHGFVWKLACVLAVFSVGVWASHFYFDARLSPAAYLFVGPGAMLALGLVVIHARWRLVLTDRRVLVRRFFARGYEEMRRSEVETVRWGHGWAGAIHRIVFSGGGREIEVASLSPLGEEFQAINLGHGPRGHTDAGQKTVLESDETVIFRDPSPRSIRLWWVFHAAIFILAPVMIYLAGLFMAERVSWFYLVAVYVGQLGIILGHERDNRWRMIVTDRRVLIRRHIESELYDEVALSDIENVRYDPANWEVVIEGGGHRIGVGAWKHKAARILAELGRA